MSRSAAARQTTEAEDRCLDNSADRTATRKADKSNEMSSPDYSRLEEKTMTLCRSRGELGRARHEGEQVQCRVWVLGGSDRGNSVRLQYISCHDSIV
jgi:hypothetical protein